MPILLLDAVFMDILLVTTVSGAVAAAILACCGVILVLKAAFQSWRTPR